MKILLLFLFLFIQEHNCGKVADYFNKINDVTLKFNAIAADIAWYSSVDPNDPTLAAKAKKYQRDRIAWQQGTCDDLTKLSRYALNETLRRQMYLLCRGPKYTFEETRKMSILYENLQKTYTEAKICINTSKNISKENLKDVEDAISNYLSTVKSHLNPEDDFILLAAKISANNEEEEGVCLEGEDSINNMMKTSRNENVLRWLWLVWREKVGPPMREPYNKLVAIENKAAIRNGYSDIGAAWREELEIPNLRQKARQLYRDMKPLYTILHGVTRFFLRKQYGDIVQERGPIPAHLLGDLWSQNWESLIDLIVQEDINLDVNIKKHNWTVLHMVKHAEDFYQSLGLPPMTDTFWRESVFERENSARCHGTAADMFRDGDFRILYCSGTTMEDLYVIHHEMGHIQYYMAYEDQPGLFQQANTALHETIGDTIHLGATTPQHLYRLGLINDTILYDDGHGNVDLNDEGIEVTVADDDKKVQIDLVGGNGRVIYFGNDAKTNDNVQYNKTKEDKDDIHFSSDDILMLKQALSKIPQIPFALLIDEYRWKYFEGGISNGEINKVFWEMSNDLMGIEPVGERGEEYFDVGAKFHVPDNTPYIRYFISYFLQHQLYEVLCKAAVFGRRDVIDDVPATITMNRCDLYGAKAVGKILKDIMSRGHSENFLDILKKNGIHEISATSLKRYYRPLYKVLQRLVRAHRIPIGW